METRIVERDGAHLAYDILGQGTPLILLQGFGMPGLAWRDIAHNLAMDDFRVILPDNRGTGRSSRGTHPYTTDMLARDLVSILDDAGCGPALVAGFSLGGMVAQRLTLQRPDLVSGLVLAATTCGLPVARPPAISTLITFMRLCLTPSNTSHASFLSRLTHPNFHDRSPALLQTWSTLFAQYPTPTSTYLAQVSAAARHNTGFELGRINVPVEVITGERDQFLPTINAKVLADRIPGARLTLVPHTAHLFPEEAPGTLEAAISRVRLRIENAPMIAAAQ